MIVRNRFLPRTITMAVAAEMWDCGLHGAQPGYR
jgi:hypothetical protein